MSERDREIDAAWREASREEPPTAVDAAIRAEARRAVGAAPGRKRHKQWQYPFAAAATVAVLALGIAQLTPPERVAPVVVVADSSAPRQAENAAARQNAPVEVTTEATPAAPAVPAPATTKPEPVAREPRVAQGSIERERPTAPPAMKKQAPQTKEETPAPPRSEPFPANAQQTDARNDVYADAPRTAAAAPPAAAPAGASTPQASRSPALETQATRLAAAKTTNVDEARAKDAGARSVDDWIGRIRELKNAGRIDDAAKELAAFRAAFGERADALLPSDLRAWASAAPAPAAR